MNRLDREQAAIVSAFTGFLAGPFSDLQAYADRVLGYETYTHEFGSKDFANRLKEAARPDFLAIVAKEDDEPD